MMKARGFTLIELMIVVAVIAILAAIAVPNFLAAQVRSKVSRAKADMATIRTALEAYAVDQNSYPLNAGGMGFTGALYNLTKPIAYISNIPKDVFQEGNLYQYLSGGSATTIQQNKFGSYTVASAGPDLQVETSLGSTLIYDPSNGTVSDGDIVFSHLSSDQDQVALSAERP
ncbi:prepilin-type N-terminal cleavage/methylation domain-containing protein [Candidatus Poribacteria bacterium]|nr:prepilin-type N-terminal cleavage/methylation domain-containing protein [Candidatus Poribacteria bacterium]